MTINNDGIDIDSSSEVLIENCRFSTGDDAVVFKSGRDQDGWRVNKPTRNVVVRNCIAEDVLHGIAFGSEMSGGIENIFVENFILKNVKKEAIQFKANKDRGGYIRNIWLNNIHVDSAGSHLLFFWNDYYGYRGGNAPSDFNHIFIKNLTCAYASNAFRFHGLKDKPIHHVYLTNVIIEECGNLYSNKAHYHNLYFENVKVNNRELSPP